MLLKAKNLPEAVRKPWTEPFLEPSERAQPWIPDIRFLDPKNCKQRICIFSADLVCGTLLPPHP